MPKRQFAQDEPIDLYEDILVKDNGFSAPVNFIPPVEDEKKPLEKSVSQKFVDSLQALQSSFLDYASEDGFPESCHKREDESPEEYTYFISWLLLSINGERPVRKIAAMFFNEGSVSDGFRLLLQLKVRYNWIARAGDYDSFRWGLVNRAISHIRTHGPQVAFGYLLDVVTNTSGKESTANRLRASIELLDRSGYGAQTIISNPSDTREEDPKNLSLDELKRKFIEAKKKESAPKAYLTNANDIAGTRN